MQASLALAPHSSEAGGASVGAIHQEQQRRLRGDKFEKARLKAEEAYLSGIEECINALENGDETSLIATIKLVENLKLQNEVGLLQQTKKGQMLLRQSDRLVIELQEALAEAVEAKSLQALAARKQEEDAAAAASKQGSGAYYESGVDELSARSVVALGPVVARAGLAENVVVWAEDLAVGASTKRVHGTGLEIHEHGAGRIAATRSGLHVVNVDALVPASLWVAVHDPLPLQDGDGLRVPGHLGTLGNAREEELVITGIEKLHVDKVEYEGCILTCMSVYSVPPDTEERQSAEVLARQTSALAEAARHKQMLEEEAARHKQMLVEEKRIREEEAAMHKQILEVEAARHKQMLEEKRMREEAEAAAQARAEEERRIREEEAARHKQMREEEAARHKQMLEEEKRMREKIEAASKARAEEEAARHKQMLEEEKRIREKAEAAARHKQMLELGNEALARAAVVEYRLSTKSEEAKATAIAREEAEYREALQANARAKLEEQTARVGRLLEERKFLNQIILHNCMPATASCQESPFALLAQEVDNPAGAAKRIFEARAKLKITELELHHAKIMLEELIKRMELHQT